MAYNAMLRQPITFLHGRTTTLTLALVLLCYCASVSATVEFTVLSQRSKGITESVETLKQGEGLSLSPNGLLWARSNGEESEYYDFICQNRSSDPVTISFELASRPWFEVKASQSCTEWQDTVLACPSLQAPQFVCRLIVKDPSEVQYEAWKKQQTAVNLRSSNGLDWRATAQQVFKDYSASIDLCKAIHGKQHVKGAVAFTVNKGGNTQNVTIVKEGEHATPDGEMPYAKCVQSSIQSWKFPMIRFGYEPLTYTFNQ
ncbi:hypothetical protein [Alteromonas facilis]|uniref:hypothetical protein n=1 Tax=Alteromonas facilis TaxID=2048004 RepID=UPI000C288FDD|nr:hypothetical protein [Alteromonas facilis]